MRTSPAKEARVLNAVCSYWIITMNQMVIWEGGGRELGFENVEERMTSGDHGQRHPPRDWKDLADSCQREKEPRRGRDGAPPSLRHWPESPGYPRCAPSQHQISETREDYP